MNASVMMMIGVPNKYACERGGWATDNILKTVYQQTYSSERERVDDLVDSYYWSAVKAEKAARAANMQVPKK